MDSDATRPLEEAASGEGREPEATAHVGQLIGRYVLLGELGHGGEGHVFEAFDTELERKVALKLLRGGSPTLAARREARAQAKLDHPAVVSIYDVGDADGHAYIAMELMERQAFAQWCGETSPAEVLDALRRVATGIQAAHASGLVHGDIKPSNILRSQRGEPKLSDFGVARATGRTEDGLVGTRAFMAPELWGGAAASPASDQYAFCLTAWMVFHGTLPGRDAVAPTQDGDGLRTDRDVSPTGPLALTWSAQGVPAPVQQALLRGLRPDPATRWPSMAELALVLQPPAPRRRSRWLLGGTTVALGLGTTAMFGATTSPPDPCAEAQAPMEALWTPARRDAALQPLREAGYAPAVGSVGQALDDYAAAWEAQSAASCTATHVRRAQSEALLDRRTACLDRALGAFEATTDVLQRSAQGRDHAHALLDALPPLAECEAPPPPEGPAALPDDPKLRARIETASRDLDRLEVLRIARADDEATALIARLEPEVRALDHLPLQLSLWLSQAHLLRERGDFEQASALGDQALARAIEQAQTPQVHAALELLVPLRAYDMQQLDRAETYLPSLLAFAEDPAIAEDDRAAAWIALATADHAAGRYALGLERSQRALDLHAGVRGEDVAYASMLNDHAVLQHSAGENEAAIATHRRAEALRRALLGDQHPDVAQSLDNLAQVLGDVGRDDEALLAVREGLDILERSGHRGYTWAVAHNTLGLVLAKQRRWPEAIAAFEVALAQLEESLGEDHPTTAVARDSLGFCLGQQGDYDAALALMETSHRIQAQARGDDHPALLRSLANYGEMLCRAGRLEEGLRRLREARTLGSEKLGPGNPDTIYAANLLALSLYKADRWAEARDAAQQALDDHERGPGGTENNIESLRSIQRAAERHL